MNENKKVCKNGNCDCYKGLWICDKCMAQELEWAGRKLTQKQLAYDRYMMSNEPNNPDYGG